MGLPERGSLRWAEAIWDSLTALGRGIVGKGMVGPSIWDLMEGMDDIMSTWSSGAPVTTIIGSGGMSWLGPWGM